MDCWVPLLLDLKSTGLSQFLGPTWDIRIQIRLTVISSSWNGLLESRFEDGDEASESCYLLMISPYGCSVRTGYGYNVRHTTNQVVVVSAVSTVGCGYMFAWAIKKGVW